MKGKSSHLNRGDLISGIIAVVTTNYEKSAEAVVVKTSDESQKERRAEQSISWSIDPTANKATSAILG